MKKSNKHTPNKRNAITLLLSLILMLGIMSQATPALAQTSYKLSAGSRISVSGTSNLHDWMMTANSFTSEGMIVFKGDQLVDITALQFSLPTKNLKSKEDLMDTRAYKTLKAAEFTKITFRLTKASIASGQKTVQASGNLSIAGKSNSITMVATFSGDPDELTLKGSRVIKMTDYGMKAPSFMLGALKTGNEVTVDFVLKLKKSDLNNITKN